MTNPTNPRPLRRLSEPDLVFALARAFGDSKARSKQKRDDLNSLLHQVAAESVAKSLTAQGYIVLHPCAAEYAAAHPGEVVEVPEGDA